MPCNIESASLEPKSGEKFVAGGEDMWVRVFDFYTGEEIGESRSNHLPYYTRKISLYLVRPEPKSDCLRRSMVLLRTKQKLL